MLDSDENPATTLMKASMPFGLDEILSLKPSKANRGLTDDKIAS
jgi:hypothetical protein